MSCQTTSPSHLLPNWKPHAFLTLHASLQQQQNGCPWRSSWEHLAGYLAVGSSSDQLDLLLWTSGTGKSHFFNPKASQECEVCMHLPVCKEDDTMPVTRDLKCKWSVQAGQEGRAAAIIFPLEGRGCSSWGERALQ